VNEEELKNNIPKKLLLTYETIIYCVFTCQQNIQTNKADLYVVV